MTKLREKITVENIYLLSELFECIDIAHFKNEVRNIKAYLQDGYRYASNVKEEGIEMVNIVPYLDILDTLEMCAEDMASAEEGRFLSMSFGGKKCVNLEPFIDFLETMEDQSYTHYDFREITEVMKNYLNASNIAEFKKGSNFIGNISGVIMELYDNFEKREKLCQKN